MSNWNDFSVAGERASLAAPACTRSWEWLLEMRRHLKVDLQLLDHRQSSLLPTSGEADVLSRLLAAPPAALSRAIAAAFEGDTPQSLTVGSTHVVCCGIAVDRRQRYALIVARTHGEGVPDETVRNRLIVVTSLLRPAIQVHLASPAAISPSLQHIVPLWRLLATAGDGEADRHVVAAFAEAMAVWHDIDVRGYVKAGRGTFLREVAGAGRLSADGPIILPDGAAPVPLELKHVPQADVDADASPFAHDVLFTSLRGVDTPGGWLIVLSGAIDNCDLHLLNTYVALLDLAVASATATARARVQSMLTPRFWTADPARPEEGVAPALADVRQLLSSQRAVLTATSHGTRLWSAEQAEPLAPGATTPAQLAVASHRHADALTLTLSRTDGRRFTYTDYQVADVAVKLVHSWWHRGSVSAPGTEMDPFEQELDRLAQQALDRGTPVTVVVLAVGSTFGRRLQAQQVDVVRPLLRSDDAIGVLRDGSVAVLLTGADAGLSRVILPRIERAVEEIEGGPWRVSASGIATRTPQQQADGSVLDQARRSGTSPGPPFSSSEDSRGSASR